MIKEFTYNFRNELMYAKDGEPVKAETITVKAPRNNVLRQVSLIEQYFEQSQVNMLKAFKDAIGDVAFQKMLESRGVEETAKEVKGKSETSEIMKQFYAGGANLDKCYEALRQILISGNTESPTAVLDSRVKITSPIFSDMTPEDTKNILGEYVINFIIASQQSSKDKG